MEKIPTEIMVMILNVLDFKSQIRFIFTSKKNKHLLKYWIITERIYVNKKVLKWSHYDNLINIVIDKLLENYPKNLQFLSFDRIFNKPINGDSIPKTVTYIHFGWYFNQTVDNLPTSIIHLIFGRDFNQPPNNIPTSVKYLIFGHDFNQSVDKLPSSIKNIEFGHHFNQTVDKLPSFIKNIEFGHRFNQSVDKLPSFIKNIEFGCNFNQSIKNLPSTVTHLEIGWEFNRPLKDIPNRVRSVWPYPFYIKRIWPKTIIGHTFDYL